MPARFCVFDVETRGREAAFSSGAYWSDQRQDWHQAPDVYLEALRWHAQRRYTLAAHNAEYDLVTFLWRQGEDVTLHFYEGTFVHAAWRWGEGPRTAPIWDSMRLSGGMSVEDLGAATGLPKYPTPQRLLGRDPDRYAWTCEAHDVGECERCYTLRDCEIVYKHLDRLQQYIGAAGVDLKRTLPSTGVDFWLQLDPNQLQTIRSPELRALGRAAMHGGRCEVFRYGTVGPVFTQDVRRHYGAIMGSNPMPDIAHLAIERNLPPDWPLEGKEGVIEATIAQEPLYCPTLPVARDGVLCYPNGTFRGSWAIVEARRAIERGARVLAIHQAAYSTRTVFPFLNTAGALLLASCEWEDAGNPLYLPAKQLLNAIFGRLGMQEGGEQRIYKRWQPGLGKLETIGWEPTITSDAVYLHQTHVMAHPPATSNIIWAVQIAALGRLKLLDRLELAGDQLLYCDTDSVHTRSPLLEEGRGPGQWRDTGTYQLGRYLAPKLYKLVGGTEADQVRAKGVRRTSAAEFFDTGRAAFDAFLGVQQALATGAEPGRWVEVERVRHLGLSRRQLVNQLALVLENASSDTWPLSFGPD